MSMKLDLSDAATFDFETLPIEPRPSYPPTPVGVAVKWGGEPARYFAWAHPHGDNNCSFEEARAELLKACQSKRPLLAHNLKFDWCVLREKMGLPPIEFDRLNDTLPMLFLRDPRASTYELKPSAELLLGEPPAERDAVIDWLVAHQPVLGVKLVAKKPKNKGESDSRTKYAGAYVAYAPVSLVGPYAIGDVDRTWRLAQMLAAHINENDMVAAYRREVDLCEPLMDLEKRGVPVDLILLEQDVEIYSAAMLKVDAWLRRRLKVPKGADVNWDSNAELVAHLLRAAVASEDTLGVTASGKVQSNKDALARGVTDTSVLAVLKYRSRVVSSLDTFMRPWLATARRSGGRIYTTWYTTRHDEHGARTGRMASSPNLQNMTKKKVALFSGAQEDWWEKLALPELPYVRRYIIAEKGDVLVDRDKSQQEIRIFAHYEDGPLCEAYNASPWLDLYNQVLPVVNSMLPAPISRDAIKTTVLAKLYGMGVGLLAERLKVDDTTAKSISDAVLSAVPGLRTLARALKDQVAKHLPIRTWGGRLYYCEESKLVDGRMRDFAYKMINVLIQASAADDLKECILWFWRNAPIKYKLLLAVHDELVVSAPKGEMHEAMALLKQAMDHVKFDVPMLSEGKYGPNMASLVDYDKKGVDVYAGKNT